jgi:hypothetical protein
MKRTIIGSIFLLTGMLNLIGTIISGSIYSSMLKTWDTSYGTKLWFSIFCGASKFNDGMDGLGLNVFFIFGILLIILGLVILLKEYFNSTK